MNLKIYQVTRDLDLSTKFHKKNNQFQPKLYFLNTTLLRKNLRFN